MSRESAGLDQTYLFCPPNRYIFQGAEVYREDDDDDCCSTSTDYSSDSDSPQMPHSDDGSGSGDINNSLLQNEYAISQSSNDQPCPVNESGIDSKHSNESPKT
ncbi:NAD-dependent protein deacetylase sirtuin-1 [Trichonephila clavipes]|nr:NAD-dependent protein deacetylase sirtuin-1 [Trichonephila clavipes]